MKSELKKIQAYFAEANKTWPKNPEMVLSRDFFELWETTHQPEPFAVKDPELNFLDTAIKVPARNTVAHFCWDFAEECACLVLEAPDRTLRYPITFSDGSGRLGAALVSELDDSGVDFGERLEFILEVIAWVRRHRPSRNILEMRKSEYSEALRQLAPKYDERTVRLMSMLRLPAVHKLIRMAARDMALDELSDQLVLPLDGNYAAGSGDARMVVAEDRAFEVHPAPPRSAWTITRDLQFLSRAGEILVQLEQDFVLSFKGCETLHGKGKNPVTLKIPVKSEIPLREGEKLQVFTPGEKEAVATFQVDINDRNNLIGRLHWPDRPGAVTGELVARPQRGPARFLAQLVDAGTGEFQRRGRFESPALNAALGIGDFRFEDSALPEGEAELDSSQQRAWANALNPNNSLVLIQGPPGTGKTHVLVRVLEKLCAQGRRVLVAAPSNKAVDNICRRVFALPVLRLGRERERIAPDVAGECWIGELACVHRFQTKRAQGAAVYAGTHVGVLRDEIVLADLEKNGLFDVIIFDEAGMARLDEFLVCTKLARHAILFGDQQQLRPFPLPEAVLETLKKERQATRSQQAMLTQSALEWLDDQRHIPVFVLENSFRCQNPRLMRFSSTMFYEARVRASVLADYYQLPFAERQAKYPPSTLRFYSTSKLSLKKRREVLSFEGGRPGFENPAELTLTVKLFHEALERYPLDEISIIAPYRRQVRRLREQLSPDRPEKTTKAVWDTFLHTRIATVDSFQGGESDLVIISYVRSGGGNIGFVDDPHRINVAHTRCRREMWIIGDLECLTRHAGNRNNRIFHRMERAIARDGEIIEVQDKMLKP